MKEKCGVPMRLLLLALVLYFLPISKIEAGIVLPVPQDSKELPKEGKDLNSPEIISKVAPKYPEEAKKAGIMGEVRIEAVVDEEGIVQEVKATNEADALLIKAAMEAVKQWKFKPVIKEGKPVRIKTTVTLNFRLK